MTKTDQSEAWFTFQCSFSLQVFVFLQVRDVRTTDDTLLTVKLMIFFELTDIIEMVNAFRHNWARFFLLLRFATQKIKVLKGRIAERFPSVRCRPKRRFVAPALAPLT